MAIWGFFISKKRRAQSEALLKLQGIVQELSELRTALVALRDLEPLDRLVAFFASVAPWYDRLDEIRTMLHTLEPVSRAKDVVPLMYTVFAHVDRAGRSPYGMNRTKQGEQVTEHRVYLGGVYGLFTLSVEQWKACRSDPRDCWADTRYSKQFDGLNEYDVIVLHAESFMETHVEPMINSIEQVGSSMDS